MTATGDAPRHAPIAVLPSESDRRRYGADLARFFEYSHDVLAILDREGEILVISPSVQRVLGYRPDEVVGRSLLEQVHPDDREAVADEWAALWEDQAAGDPELRVADVRDDWVPMRWWFVPGEDGLAYGVGQDDRRRLGHRAALLRQEMSELRLRTARELHDGILQTLTGAGLQIAVARKLLRVDPSAAEKVLETLAESVSAEQQEMRLYVDELKGRAPVWTDDTRGFPDRIEAMLDRVSAIWGVPVSVDARVPQRIRGELGRQVVRIIQEATVNAARHGEARSVAVTVEEEDGEIVIRIADEGKGFPFLGDYDHEALTEKRLGPLSLKHRVQEAGGRISISSRPRGSTVVVRVPAPPAREWPR